MPLPDGGKVPWPPVSERNAYTRYAEHSAWYSGAAAELERFYGGYAGRDRTEFFDQSLVAQPYTSVWRRFAFWARQDPGSPLRGRVHIPMAADIASTSSDLLFSDSPTFLIPEAHTEKPKRDAKKAQDELDIQIERCGLRSTLSEGSEVQSALGGVFLRVQWDKALADHPLLNVVHPDAAVPEFKWGYLTAVTFWQVVYRDDKSVFRYLQRHERGVVLHGVYKGTDDLLGDRMGIGEVPESIQYLIANERVQLPDQAKDLLTTVYIPNMLPSRADRASRLGRSDYEGAEGLLDALDETWTSWMRDLRLGKARLFVPQEFLTSLGKGRGARFDLDREIYEAINLSPQADVRAQISPQQFEIRVSQHADTVENLIERIVAATGYSASTFGIKSVATVERTATEVKAREHRSLTTRGKKIEYWNPALGDILYVYLVINNAIFEGAPAFRPRAEFPPSVQESSLDLANSVKLLRDAGALSIQMAVAMAHPDWDPDMVAAETERLKQEKTVSVTTDTGAAPADAAVQDQPKGSPSPSAQNTPGGPQQGPQSGGSQTST